MPPRVPPRPSKINSSQENNNIIKETTPPVFSTSTTAVAADAECPELADVVKAQPVLGSSWLPIDANDVAIYLEPREILEAAAVSEAPENNGTEAAAATDMVAAPDAAAVVRRPKPIVDDTVPHHKLVLQDVHPIGSGAFGEVYKAVHRDWGCQVAYKRLQTKSIGDHGCAKELTNEAEIHRQLHHPNIVHMFGIVFEEGNYGLVLEYVLYGTLYCFLLRINRNTGVSCSVSWKLKARMVYDVVSGMSYLHTLRPIPVIHGDLKIQNILVGEQLSIKIADFGLSKWKDYSRTLTKSDFLQGTPSNIPPEKWSNYSLKSNDKFDVYAFGILQWEIYTEEKAFQNCGQGEIAGHVINGARPHIDKLSKDIPSNVKACIVACWDKKPNNRPSFTDLLRDLNPSAVGCSSSAELESMTADALAAYKKLQGIPSVGHPQPPHALNLARVASKLAEMIRRVQQILEYLRERDVVTSQEYDTIRSQTTVHDQTIRLIAMLSEKQVTAYQCFLEALTATNQLHLHHLLVDKETDFVTDHQQILIHKFSYLKGNIQITNSTLLQLLLEKYVLDMREIEEIKSEKTEFEKAEKLIHFMIRTSPDQYQQFLHALNKGQHGFICDELVQESARRQGQICRSQSAGEQLSGTGKNNVFKRISSLFNIKLGIEGKTGSKESKPSDNAEDSHLKLLATFTTGHTVWGVTQLFYSIFVISHPSNVIDVYNSITFQKEKPVTLETKKDGNLDAQLDVRDMTSCSKQHCLYIYDSDYAIWRVMGQGRGRMDKWLSIKGKVYNATLHVTSEGHLLLSCPSPARIDIYGPDAIPIHTITLPSEVGIPHHVVESRDCDLVVVSRCRTAEFDKVVVLNKQGSIVGSWDKNTSQLRDHVAVDREGRVFAISVDIVREQLLLLTDISRESGNNCVVVLSDHALVDGQVNVAPHRLFYSRDSGRLIVGHRWSGRIDVFDVIY